jgi:HlyD family secretion protein
MKVWRRTLFWALVTILAAVSIMTVSVILSSKSHQSADAPAPVRSTQDNSISCLGRIEPEDGVIRISARSISGQPSIVGELRVNEGDFIERGQIVAILNSKEQLEAVWHRAEARVSVARSALAQVKAGAKAADIAAQRARITRFESELAFAQVEYRRNEQLHQKGVVPLSILDSKRLLMDTAAQMLGEAKERLNGLTEVRRVDIDLAEAELDAAIKDAHEAQVEFVQSMVRSPMSGRVIKVHVWPGEQVGSEGIVELGKTDSMYVIAEVAETDIGRVRVGQHATITTEALAENLPGVVEEIGLQVAKNDVLHTDPTAFSDARVVEVKIRLRDGKKVSGLIHGQVTVLIMPHAARVRETAK